jgi:hypothetical protein
LRVELGDIIELEAMLEAMLETILETILEAILGKHADTRACYCTLRFSPYCQFDFLLKQ